MNKISRSSEDEDEENVCSPAYFLQLSKEIIEFLQLFMQQVILVFLKCFRQKWVNGRNSIKTTILIPLGVLGFTAIVCVSIMNSSFPNANYNLRELPPLSRGGSLSCT